MNLPNKLTVLRMCLVPAIIVVLILPVNAITSVIGAFIFIAASLTDMLDGKIARRDGLVTDFGKLMDPLADKLMVIAAMMCIIYRSHNVKLVFNIFMPLVMITVFRELAVTSIRLVAIKNANIVVAANMFSVYSVRFDFKSNRSNAHPCPSTGCHTSSTRLIIC